MESVSSRNQIQFQLFFQIPNACIVDPADLTIQVLVFESKLFFPDTIKPLST
ncbi:hypothetical protein LEP1GSC061_0289 [Leptospira wolffii serovar Khorat str. Khorat-H2]|nr:hypothetical protein LEP1GSC061_0289 [Leptospira wolffii serovar Khorat str. Khorat-H2]